MTINDILTPHHTVVDHLHESKKRVLELISEISTRDQPDINAKEVLECLVTRERLGTTNIGHGVAIPHGRIAGLAKPVGVLLRLEKPVNFDEADNAPVDLLFALLVPEHAEEEHLNLLADIAKRFRNKQFRTQLRHAKTNQDLYSAMNSSS